MSTRPKTAAPTSSAPKSKAARPKTARKKESGLVERPAEFSLVAETTPAAAEFHALAARSDYSGLFNSIRSQPFEERLDFVNA
jgi:hypothetical protein